MTTLDILRTSIRSLRSNIGRSLLTMIGIIIGVGAIVLVLSLGRGARQIIIQEIQSVGGDTVIIRPGRQPEGPNDFADTLFADSLKEADVAALRRPGNVTGIRSINPAVIVPGSLSYKDTVYRPTILGWNAEAVGEIFNIFPEAGNFFTEEDIRARAKVAVIGARVKTELFGEDDAIGRTIKLHNHSLRVVGVLPPRGQVSFFNLDEMVLIPYTTAQRTILGINHYHEIMIRTESPEIAASVAEDIRLTLRERHRITDPAKDDFFVVTQQDIVERVAVISRVLTIFLVAIAAISLIVGGVGIMNIMLVAVTERTREIGLRKAVGATNADIRRQFLLEALLLTVSGGALGTSLAVIASLLIAVIVRSQFGLAWQFELPISAVALGIGMATLVGLGFGIYPAAKAAKQDPIEALRYE